MKRIPEKLLLTFTLLLLLALGRAYGQNLSLDIDGNDDDVIMGLSATPIGLNPTDFTIELWFRSTDAVPSPGLCPDGMRTLMGMAGQVFNLEVTECNGRLYVSELFPLSAPINTDIAATNQNVWQHLRIDYAAGAFQIYLDCILVHSINKSIPSTVAQFVLGEYLNTSGVSQPRHWLGQVDEVRIWEAVQPTDPTCARPFCPLAGNEPDLMAYWNFDQGIGNGNNVPLTTIVDQTTNGNDGVAANFVGNGNTSNLVNFGAPLVGPSLHSLGLTIRDYPYQTAPLTTICSGDPAHFTLDLNGNVPGPFSNVSVVWEYRDDAVSPWLPLNSPPFTDFQFPILPGVLTANCGPSPTGFVDRSFRAIATVTEAGTGRQCAYTSSPYDLTICCPVSPFTVDIAPPDPLCEGESVNWAISITSSDAWVATPGINTTISWQVTDENGTRALPGQNQNPAFSYLYTAPALSAPLDVCFTATVTNCNGKVGTAQSCVRVDPEPECGLIDAMPLGAPQNLTQIGTIPHPTYEICPGDDAIVGIDPVNPFDKCIPQWQYSFDNISWTNLGFSNTVQNTNILPSHLWLSTADRIYYRIECAPLSNPSGCDPCYSNLIEVRLTQAPVAGTINGPTQECLEDVLAAPVQLTVNNPVAGITYQWLHNGLPFGTGNSQLVTKAGCYWLEASNGCQTRVGNKHCIEICETVAIMSCPLAPNDCARLGDPVTVSACGSYSTCGSPAASFGYKWYVNGAFQAGQSGCTFTFLPIAAGNTVRVDIVDPVTGCAGSVEQLIVPCDF
ncbi:MAG: hypothetical protein ACI81P_002269 [Neolewinella sp.]|jgi:hypothetical protein